MPARRTVMQEWDAFERSVSKALTPEQLQIVYHAYKLATRSTLHLMSVCVQESDWTFKKAHDVIKAELETHDAMRKMRKVQHGNQEKGSK